jgi:hypothetical protein
MNKVIFVEKISDNKAKVVLLDQSEVPVNATSADKFQDRLIQLIDRQYELYPGNLLVQIIQVNGKKNNYRYDPGSNTLMITNEKNVIPKKRKYNAPKLKLAFAVVGVFLLGTGSYFGLRPLFDDEPVDDFDSQIVWLTNYQTDVKTTELTSTPSTENNSDPETSEPSQSSSSSSSSVPSSVLSPESTQTQEYNPSVYTPAPAPQPQPKPSPTNSIPIEETEIFVTE